MYLKFTKILLVVLKVFISLFVFTFRTLISAAVQMDSGSVDFNSLALHSIGKFCLMFFVSAIIGAAFGLICALVRYLHSCNTKNWIILHCFVFWYHGFLWTSFFMTI